MHRKTNAVDGGSGFVIASDVVMHHAKVDGKRIARPPWCQRVFLGNCCGNSLYRRHLRCILDCDDGNERDERRNEDVALGEITARWFRFCPWIERTRMKKIPRRHFYAPFVRYLARTCKRFFSVASLLSQILEEFCWARIGSHESHLLRNSSTWYNPISEGHFELISVSSDRAGVWNSSIVWSFVVSRVISLTYQRAVVPASL